MALTNLVKYLLQHNKDLIRNEQWYELYEEIEAYKAKVGRVTDALLQAGIDPLQTLKWVPNYYLAETQLFENFTLPSQIRTIEIRAFLLSSIKNMKVGPMLETIGHDAFAASELKTINLQDTAVKNILSCAFQNCHLETIELPNTVELIGDKAFLDIPSLHRIKFNSDVNLLGSTILENDKPCKIICPKDAIKVINYFAPRADGRYRNIILETY